MPSALVSLRDFVVEADFEYIWANGTKFDLGMLEYQYKKLGDNPPWPYNADGCMRTLKLLAKAKGFHDAACAHADEQDCGIAHNALADAKWQAHYIAFVYNKLI